jgi:hypothetical protein
VSDNVFAPPKSNLEREATEDAPELWNPRAAVWWSLLLSNAFGAYIHMRNWEAMGEPEAARTSRNWIIAVIVVIIVTSFGGQMSRYLDPLGNLTGIVLLLAWYAHMGSKQLRAVKERYGDDYPRKGWLKPILIGIVIFLVAIVLIGLVAYGLARAGLLHERP